LISGRRFGRRLPTERGRSLTTELRDIQPEKRIDPLVDGVFLCQTDIWVLYPFKQFADERVVGDTLGPVAPVWVEVSIHQELTEAQKC
jgi:hypothetical protein